MTVLRRHDRRTQKNTRNSLTREVARHHTAMRESYEELVADGHIKPVEEWDIEELSRGRPRNRGGGWGGSSPAWLAQPVQEEIRRRFKQEAVSHLVRYFPRALNTLVELLEEDDPAIRLKACQLLIEYAVGKPTTHTEISADKTTTGMLAAALVMPDGQAAHPVIMDGEVIEDD